MATDFTPSSTYPPSSSSTLLEEDIKKKKKLQEEAIKLGIEIIEKDVVDNVEVENILRGLTRDQLILLLNGTSSLLNDVVKAKRLSDELDRIVRDPITNDAFRSDYDRLHYVKGNTYGFRNALENVIRLNYKSILPKAIARDRENFVKNHGRPPLSGGKKSSKRRRSSFKGGRSNKRRGTKRMRSRR
jgi:hypothetical protein